MSAPHNRNVDATCIGARATEFAPETWDIAKDSLTEAELGYDQ